MFAAPPRPPAWRSWLVVAVWTLCIYCAIPLARSVEGLVAEHAGRSAFGWAVIAAAALPLAIAAWRSLRDPETRRRVSLAGLAAVAIAFVGCTAWLWSNPEEAMHLLQYGVLGVLVHRALAQRMRDPAIYVVAALAVAILGTFDEIIQWMTPSRFWGLRDIAINLSAGALAQVGIAFGLRPPYVSGALETRSIRCASRLAMGLCGLVLLSFLNTPRLVEAYASRVPGLAFLSDNPSVMAEYGSRICDPGFGCFRTRLDAAGLAHQDATRASEAAAVLDTFGGDDGYARFLKEYPSHRDPFLHELRVHLFRRDRYASYARTNQNDDEERAKLNTVALFEDRIVEKYFPNSLAASSYRWDDEQRRRLEEDWMPGFVTESAVSRELIVGLRRWQLAAAGVLLLLGLGWVGHRFGREPSA